MARMVWKYSCNYLVLLIFLWQDFIQLRPATSVRQYAKTRRENLEKYVGKMIQSHALNAAVLNPDSYSSVEKGESLKMQGCPAVLVG
eukprot:SAG11_NODE_5351_length_1587_cov_1.038306_1_plen_87_part_00